MADEHQFAVGGDLFQCAADALGAATDVVDGGQVAVLLQQGAGLAVVLFGIVLAFTHPHHLHQRKLLLEQVQKTGLALFVGAVTQRAHDHRHTGLATVGQRAHEAGDQVRSGAARGPVVQSHIGNAARVGQVGNQRDGGHTLLCQLGHRLTHHGVL